MSDVTFEANRDPKLDAKLAASDNDALSAMDAPQEEGGPEEIPARVQQIVKEIKEDEPPAEPPKKPEDDPAPPPPEDDDFQKRLDEAQPKKGAHPNTAKGYEHLKGVAKEERDARKAAEKEAKELKEKLDSLETEYKGKAITPEMEKEIEELKELRRTVQIENDPEFKQKYDSRTGELETRALSILKSSNLPPDVEKFIVGNGGVLAMHSSSQAMPRPYQDQTFKQFIEESLMDRLTGVARTRFEQALASGLDLKDEMSREIELAKTKGSERQQQRQKEIQDLFTQSAEATRKSFGKMAEKLEYPKDATPSDKAKIDKHNNRVANAEKQFSEYMRDGGRDPKKLAEALARAAQSQALMEEMEEKNAEMADRDEKIKKLEEKIESMKKSGSTGRATSAPPPSSKPQNTGKFESDDAALDKF